MKLPIHEPAGYSMLKEKGYNMLVHATVFLGLVQTSMLEKNSFFRSHSRLSIGAGILIILGMQVAITLFSGWDAIKMVGQKITQRSKKSNDDMRVISPAYFEKGGSVTFGAQSP